MPLTCPHPEINPGPGHQDPVTWKIYVIDFWERHNCLDRCTVLQQQMVESALARRDLRQAVVYLVDFGLIRKPHVRISKFEPGDHYYLLDTKRDTLEQAIELAEQSGYLSWELVRVPAAPRTGVEARLVSPRLDRDAPCEGPLALGDLVARLLDAARELTRDRGAGRRVPGRVDHLGGVAPQRGHSDRAVVRVHRNVAVEFLVHVFTSLRST